MRKSVKIFLVLFVVLATITSAQFDSKKSSFSIGAGYGGGGLDGDGAIPITAEFNFFEVNKNIQGGIFASFASTSEDYNAGAYSGEWSFTNIIVAAQSNYHFSPGETFDPFAGLALGYNVASASWEWDNNNANLSEPSASAGGFFFSGQIGFNYWFSEAMAVQVRAGYYPYISASLVFNL